MNCTWSTGSMRPGRARSIGALAFGAALAIVLVSPCDAAWRWSDILAQFGSGPALPTAPAARPVARRRAGTHLIVRYVSFGRSPAEARRRLRHGAYRDLVREIVQPVAQLRARVDHLASVLAERSASLALRDTPPVRTASGAYQATGEVTVDPNRFAADFCGAAASNFRLLVVLPSNAPSGSEIVRTALEGELQRDGYEVFDSSVASRTGELGTLAHNLMGARDDPALAARLGARFLSSFLVTTGVSGEARNVSDEAAVYTCRADVRVIRAEDGRVVFSDDYDASGSGINADRARSQALSSLAHRVAVELPDRLREQLPETPVNLTVTGLPPDRREALVSAVQQFAGVSDVRREDVPGGVALHFQSREKPYALAAVLQSREDVSVLNVQP